MRIVGDSASVKGVGRRTGSIEGIEALVNRVTVALEGGSLILHGRVKSFWRQTRNAPFRVLYVRLKQSR